jgi:hypothetical protein
MGTKEKILLAIIVTSALAIVISMVIRENEHNEQCYNIHYAECEYCHNKNLTYALCSGFCMEQRQEDKEIFCSFSPEEGCSKIPKECVI